jgi:hypothetical protein
MLHCLYGSGVLCIAAPEHLSQALQADAMDGRGNEHRPRETLPFVPSPCDLFVRTQENVGTRPP